MKTQRPIDAAHVERSEPGAESRASQLHVVRAAASEQAPDGDVVLLARKTACWTPR